MTTMILLVGEQPAPNLLPLRHYDPQQVALVHTALPASRSKADRLAALIGPCVVRPLCETDAFRVDLIRQKLETYLRDQGWQNTDLVFNLTGGTKTMALAAYEVARRLGAAAFYYQTEANQSLIHPYRFEEGNLLVGEPVRVIQTLTLDDYLRLYVGDYVPSMLPKDGFEEAVYAALKQVDLPNFEVMPATHLKELSGNVEVDVLARYGNQVAVFEVKRKAGKDGIDQLNGVTDQRTLGTYTHRFLVSVRPLDENNANLAEAYHIKVVVLESGQGGTLSAADAERLVATVVDALKPKDSRP